MSLTLKTELKDFQVKTVKWMAIHEHNNDGGLLMNDPGLGKSIAVLATIIKLPVKTLIICPAGLIDNWLNEIKKHTTISRLRVVKYYGSNRQHIELNN